MQQYSPLHKEEMAWKSIFITSCLPPHHTPRYGSQCATAAVTRGFQKFQEIPSVIETYCGSPNFRYLSQHILLTSMHILYIICNL